MDVDLSPTKELPQINITLQDITLETARECIGLKVAPEQERFVASNAASLVQSKFETYWLTKAIYNGEDMVGFAMYGDEPGYGWFITRLMVDARYQGRGYGKEALRQLVAHVQAEGGTWVGVSYEADNDVARTLYESLGFVDTGEAPYGEPVSVLTFDKDTAP